MKIKAIKEIKVSAKSDKVKRTSMGVEYFNSKDIESFAISTGRARILLKV